MAITATASSNGSANVTSSTVTLPASVAAGDLLIILLASDLLTAPAFTFPAGWTKLADVADSAHTGTVAYAIAAGGETTVAVTHTTERTNQIAWRIPAAEWHGTTVPEIATIVTGNSSTPNPGSLTPSWGSAATMWLAACTWDDSAAPTLSTYPTNYTDAQANSVGGSSAARVAGAWRTLTATSEDPGAFGLSGAETWQAWTIAVRPPVAGNVTATPGVASLALTALTPTVTASDNKVATPGVASLTISPQAPSVSVGFNVVPGVASLTLTALTPTVTASDNQTATIGVASLSLSPMVPIVTASDNQIATPGVASLSLTTFAPTVTAAAFVLGDATATVVEFHVATASVGGSESTASFSLLHEASASVS